MSITDLQGAPLREGDCVEAWLDGQRYTAGCGDHHHVILRRGDGTEIEGYSDAVRVLGGEDGR